MQHIIYGLFDPNTGNLRYIGYTSNQKRRFKDHHKLSNLKRNNHKNNWIKSLIDKGQQAEIFILETYQNSNMLPQAEIELVEYYKYIGCNLVNSTNGGDGVPITDEIRQKISKAKKGKPTWNKGLKGTQTAWNKGKSPSKETLQKMSEVQKGKHHSEEHKNKIAQAGKIKFTNDQLIAIKNDTRSSRKIANDYGVSFPVILRIKHEGASPETPLHVLLT